MSAADDGDTRSNGTGDGQDVLSKLPRTRPQRSTARRTAARSARAKTAAPSAAPKPTPAKPKANATATAGAKKPSGGASKVAAGAASGTARNGGQRVRRAARRSAEAKPVTVEEPVPRQGFASDSDERASGPVQPPGGADLVATAAEIVGELAKAGLSTGERLVKDMLARLPLS